MGREALLLLVVAIALLVITGCVGTPASLDSVTERADSTVELYLVTLGIAAVLLAAIVGLLAYALFRFRAPPGADGSVVEAAADNSRLEIAWTVGTVLVLAAVFALAVRAMRTGAAGQEPMLHVQVIGHQWWWEYRYLDDVGTVTTANELHLPTDRKVELEITAADVIHSFWVPRFGWKADAIPGHSQAIQVRVDLPGRYEGTCAEFCGLEHAWMRILIVAEPQDAFATWLEQQRHDAIPPAGSVQMRGQQVFMGGTCASCHTIRGTDAQGDVGPDLTHLGSRLYLGSGVVENSPEALMQWVRDAQERKPGALMPSFTNLSDNDLRSLAAYLSELK